MAARLLDWVIDQSTTSNVVNAEPSDFSHSPALRLLDNRDFYRETKDPLMSILCRFYVAEAHMPLKVVDVRDRIYALLGLSIDAQSLEITPDYSIDVESVYTKVSTALLGKSPRLLQLCQGTAETVNYSSWVVDWNNVRLPPSELLDSQRFMACGKGDYRYQLADTSVANHISFKGAVVTSVRDVGTTFTPDHARRLEVCRQYVNEVGEFFAMSMEITGSPFRDCTNAQLFRALSRIPVGGMETYSQDGRQYYRKATMVNYMRYKKFIDISSTSADMSGSTSSDTSGITTLQSAEKYMVAAEEMAGRKPFLSREGYVGLGPSDLKADDTIAIFYGAPVPFALRFQADGTYKLVGEVYVYSIMDGEYMRNAFTEVNFQLS
ncbi:Uu.00g141450.m01.CDS01 [Anthostomella pinea]|uniref:Uu.00g141450.m01.CDS01 n=1 Tax=Anthostomella pinea TaxID=933095 RepID=A0AAI8VR34_9PEZI|nr:Uu.00g141450.m01.CDS01 [Anthostomella pinea]